MNGGLFMNQEEQIIAALHNLYNKIAWLNKLKLAEQTAGERSEQYTSSEISCIEYIGNNVDPNGARLADACYMTTSGLSKLTKKLLKKGLIQRYQKAGNKKEIYFRLTEKGMRVYKMHEIMTEKFMARDKVVFEPMPETELENILSFLNRYDTHLDAELKQMGVDNS